MTVQTEPAATGVATAEFGPVAKRKLEIRQVWAHNLDAEFKNIRKLVDKFPYVSMDTEFPGVIHHPSKHHALLTPSERYAALKANVDALHLIQVGLAFAASPDEPPTHVFQINLREFDPRVHRHAPDSVSLLAAHGLDFAAHRNHGVRARDFASHLMPSGLVCPGTTGSPVTWVTFHSAYDFGYLVKLLVGRKLPETLPEFLNLVRVFFGEDVYDVKHMMTRCGGLYGGLDRVAASLGVEREAGRSHQAGSDSALTWDAFRRIREVYFAKEGVRGFAGVLFGLELELAVPNENTYGSGAYNKLANNSSNFKFVNNSSSNKLVKNGGSNTLVKKSSTNKLANNGGNRCAVVGGKGNRNSRKVAPQQVAVAALR